MTTNEAAWRKSSHSGGAQTSDCVEVAQLTGTVGVRDTKARDRGHVEADRDAWKGLISAIKG